ncbi:MAG TPA: ATP-grasp domain-containing protein [Roseiflexaceae bacterium]|nr:ATP-grasp domain-containing protein [Roseiflexaceae bacterium]
MPKPTLILSSRHTDDSQLLWRAAVARGWAVERTHGWRVPPHLRAVAEPVIYVEALLAPSVAAELGLALLGPPEDWLPLLPAEYRLRDVRLCTLGQARRAAGLAFAKPPNDKSFPARVYRPQELPDLPDDTAVLVAEPVAWEKEFRCFVLDREVRTCSVYLRGGALQHEQDFAADEAELAEAAAFAERVLADGRVELPRAAVLDVGVIAGRGWAVVEANSAWGAGLYGCDPDKVLDVIRHAAEPLAGG